MGKIIDLYKNAKSPSKSAYTRSFEDARKYQFELIDKTTQMLAITGKVMNEKALTPQSPKVDLNSWPIRSWAILATDKPEEFYFRQKQDKEGKWSSVTRGSFETKLLRRLYEYLLSTTFDVIQFTYLKNKTQIWPADVYTPPEGIFVVLSRHNTGRVAYFAAGLNKEGFLHEEEPLGEKFAIRTNARCDCLHTYDDRLSLQFEFLMTVFSCYDPITSAEKLAIVEGEYDSLVTPE